MNFFFWGGELINVHNLTLNERQKDENHDKNQVQTMCPNEIFLSDVIYNCHLFHVNFRI